MSEVVPSQCRCELPKGLPHCCTHRNNNVYTFNHHRYELFLQNKETKWVDLGGAYIGPTQNRILRLAKEYGVDTYKVNEKENLVHYVNVSSYT